ncbi:MAG: hypothetical protein AB8B74_05240 [Crocinitomicaceae bacterium]
MRTFFLLFISTIAFSSLNAQIISQFDWDSNPVTNATVGPNAISVSSSAVSDAGGVGGTNGLNPNLSGTPKLNINFTLTGSPTFDVPGIDFSIDYHREESVANFVNRGSSLIIGAGNQFNVSYRVDDGAGGFSTVSSGNVYAIPNDDTYRNYRFYYLPSTGEGFLLVDGVQVWTNDGPDNRNMYWTGAGNLVVGTNLDGSGNNDTHLDNMIIGSITNSALPVSLTEFSVKSKNITVLIDWTTASETNNDYFVVQKSKDGQNWTDLIRVKGAGNSSKTISYNSIDRFPFYGTSYYKLLQVDFDGQQTIYGPKSVNFLQEDTELNTLKVRHGLTNRFISVYSNVKNFPLLIYSSNGALVKRIELSSHSGSEKQIDISDLSKGLYIISNGFESKRFVKQ